MDSPNASLWGLIKSLENAVVAIATALEPIAWPFVAVLRLVLYAFASILHKLGDALVNSTAAFMSAVLQHPHVKEAAAEVMVAGMNAFAAQPDLSDKLSQVSKHMSQEDKQEAAVQIGRDLPILMGGILQGVFHRDNGDEKKRSVSDENALQTNNPQEEEKTSGDDESKEQQEASDDPSRNETDESSRGKVVVYITNETTT